MIFLKLILTQLHASEEEDALFVERENLLPVNGGDLLPVNEKGFLLVVEGLLLVEEGLLLAEEDLLFLEEEENTSSCRGRFSCIRSRAHFQKSVHVGKRPRYIEMHKVLVQFE